MAEQKQEQKPEQAQEKGAKKPRAWRAKRTCTYNGRYVKQGEIVHADEMDNPHFEKAD
jgi:hypothetical protein